MSKNRIAMRPQPTQTNQEPQVETTATEENTTTQEQTAENTQPVVEEQPVAQQQAVVQETPVAQPVAKVQEVAKEQPAVEHGFDLKDFPASPALLTILARVKATGNVAVVLTIQGFFDYCHAMRPGAVMSPTEGGIQQASLLRLFQAIIERSGNDFNIAMTAALKIVEDGRNVAFHDKYSMRFMEHVTLNYDDQRAFERLLHLFKVMAPAQSRKDAVKQISFARILEYGVSQEGRTRIQNYFNV